MSFKKCSIPSTDLTKSTFELVIRFARFFLTRNQIWHFGETLAQLDINKDKKIDSHEFAKGMEDSSVISNIILKGELGNYYPTAMKMLVLWSEQMKACQI